MAKSSKIRWDRSDYITLGKAVSQFNKKINELNAEERKLYLPEIQSYQEAKGNITTRAELNRYINSLRRFSKEGAEGLYTTEAGVEMTKWERKELGIQSRIASRRISGELATVNAEIGKRTSKVSWDNLENRRLTLEGTLKNIGKIEQLKGKAFEHQKEIIENQGVSDYDMKQAQNYMNLYYKEVLPQFKYFENYDLLKQKLDSIGNPIDQYKFIQKSEKLSNMDYHYDNKEMKADSPKAKLENDFDLGLQELGLL